MLYPIASEAIPTLSHTNLALHPPGTATQQVACVHAWTEFCYQCLRERTEFLNGRCISDKGTHFSSTVISYHTKLKRKLYRYNDLLCTLALFLSVSCESLHHIHHVVEYHMTCMWYGSSGIKAVALILLCAWVTCFGCTLRDSQNHQWRCHWRWFQEFGPLFI